ncbi:DNA-(apurinic or apyrimidinic site) lyase 2 isoform X3 [Myotis lucifugus]|nr:DNA-(apurinic or apyrimidinic site) lyase 2 isoform X3 [Myotis lucifugus]XP_023615808.1 DNA-(apurinic or apyrimidinic site) lyase 2 isoform X3 [Myotis lucifugus]
MRFYRLLQIRAEALLAAGSHVIILGDLNTAHRPIDHWDAVNLQMRINSTRSHGTVQSRGICPLPTRPALLVFSSLKMALSSPWLLFPEAWELSKSLPASSSAFPFVPLPFPQECFEEDPGRKWMDGLLSKLDCQGGSNVGAFIDTYRCFHPKQERAFTCWSTITGARRLNYGSRIDYVLGDRTLVIDTFQDSFLLPEVMGSDHCPVGAVLNVSSVPAKQCPPLCTRFLPEFSGTQLKILHFLVHPKQEPVSKQSVLQLSNQTQGQMRQNKAHVRSIRPRPSRAGSGKGQKKLINYFQPSSSRLQASTNLELPNLRALVTPKIPEDKVMGKGVEGQAKDAEAKDEKELRTSFWKSVLGGPLPMPLCGGHGEPCVMRTVKKAGPNQGRHFYMCSRPRGPSTDPSSRCNFFLWSRPN